MFLGELNTIFLNICNYPSHMELRVRSIKIFVIPSFVVISNVGIKMAGCITECSPFVFSFRTTRASQ